MTYCYRTLLAGLALCTAGCAYQSTLLAEDESVDMTLFFGEGALDEDFKPLDDGSQGGVVLGYGRKGTGLRYELGVSGAREDSSLPQPVSDVFNPGTTTELVDFDAGVLDVYMGVRYDFGFVSDHIRPYVAGGISLAQATVDSDPLPDVDVNDDGVIDGSDIDHAAPVDETDESIAGYLRVGVRFMIGDGLHVGVDYRMTVGHEFRLDLDELQGSGDFEGDVEFLSFGLGWTF